MTVCFLCAKLLADARGLRSHGVDVGWYVSTSTRDGPDEERERGIARRNSIRQPTRLVVCVCMDCILRPTRARPHLASTAALLLFLPVPVFLF